MSAAHLTLIDRVADLLRDALARVEGGNAPDLDTFDARLKEHFDALRALGNIEPGGVMAERCRVRLDDVKTLQTRLSAALSAVHDETGRRLGRISRGGRSIGAYRSSLEGGRRGTRRGQG